MPSETREPEVDRVTGAVRDTGLKRGTSPNMLLLFVVGDVVGAGIHALIASPCTSDG